MKESDFKPLLRKYLAGFMAALLLSVLSYTLISSDILPHAEGLVMAVLLLLAVVQLVIQLVCFLHLGIKNRSRNRTLTLAFTIAMMLVIVIGSLWIMKNLDYRMGMSSEAMNEYMMKQNKKGF